MKHKEIEIIKEEFTKNELEILLLIHAGNTLKEILTKKPKTTRKIIGKIIDKEIYFNRQKKLKDENEKQANLQAQERILLYKSLHE